MASLCEASSLTAGARVWAGRQDVSSARTLLGKLALPASVPVGLRGPRTALRACSGTDRARTRVAASAAEAAEAAEAEQAARRPQGGAPADLDSDEEVSSLMEGVTFAQLCDDFQCVSSPAVERTARLLARDIHDIREDRRSLSCFAVDVKYRDPLRAFSGRDKYRRPSWILNALERPQVNMMSMEMLSTSTLVIKWRLRGAFKVMPLAGLDLLVTSTFTLNQISGQVVEHRDSWDLSRTLPPAAATFYSSRLAWSAVQIGKDLSEGASSVGKALDRARGDGSVVYPDPSGDPRKFFVQDDPNRDLYQFALGVALIYLLVQFVRLII